jgi:hypothetical protein
MQFYFPSCWPTATEVFESYWYFAAERQRMYFRRLAGHVAVTSDPILGGHRFTNAYRASDRVSQYLIARVIPASDANAEDIFFRTLLFKIFNKIETWQLLVRELGEPHWRETPVCKIFRALSRAREAGIAIYSGAYIMPSPSLGGTSKADNHVRLLDSMLRLELHKRWVECRSLREVYELLRGVPSLGSFLAFQFAIDLGYTDFVPVNEASFVVAGPGARSGIAKCFPAFDRRPEDLIMLVTQEQDEQFAARGSNFLSLWGRRLQPIDCQNLFCEVDKYARVAYPGHSGSGRKRIKQSYRPSGKPIPPPVFPRSWGIDTTSPISVVPAFSFVG